MVDKRWDLNAFLKTSGEGFDLISKGILFQVLVPAYVKVFCETSSLL